MFNGAVLELDRGVARRLGPDILAEAPDYEDMLTRFRRADQQRQVGDALLDQRLVAGIGNLWKAESLWRARVSPWRRLEGVPGHAQVYRRKGRPCPRCGAEIRSWPQGDDARMAYWCPECQKGEEQKTA